MQRLLRRGGSDLSKTTCSHSCIILRSHIHTHMWARMHTCGHSGEHDPSKERNPLWEPYSPAARLKGLGLLGTKFTWALERRQLCVALNDGSRVKPVRACAGGSFTSVCLYVCALENVGGRVRMCARLNDVKMSVPSCNMPVLWCKYHNACEWNNMIPITVTAHVGRSPCVPGRRVWRLKTAKAHEWGNESSHFELFLCLCVISLMAVQVTL